MDGHTAREATQRGLQLPALAADMRCLPFPDGSFDVVVCADSAIPHLLTAAEMRVALDEARRVLRPGGLLLLSTRPYDLELLQLLPEGAGWRVAVRRSTYWALTQAELNAFARAARFDDVTWHDPEQTGVFQPVPTGRAG